ncbi:succinyldiaminopimelate transaminase [Desertivibrio insolitus]|uniref:succinyldiaminopimelate transaminase n=1 Tax=Herbiconiux sp. SYSU D00978 TaxID=2812562 RepID=UPI001A97AC62|nr:succinyldiaminopimelate transaminase [Herbiconiux sp. SYSU D00978]
MLALPDYPWDTLAPLVRLARSHPEGVVDLSVGSPVDPTPAVVRDGLASATDAHGYPSTAGTIELQQAIVDWYARRRGTEGLTRAHVLPTIGSKEFIAGLPLWLGLGEGDTVVHPRIAYPTYAIGAKIARATPVAADDPADWPDTTKLVWLNSPGNPDGRILPASFLRDAVARARELGAVLASDECYAELVWNGEAPAPGILDPDVTGGDFRGVLSVYSLSKQSNLAGYRAGFVAGDVDLLSGLLTVRKHAGTMPPAPVQAAMVAALNDHEHVAAQRALYADRRARLLPAVEGAGFRLDHSEGGLYLWATRGEHARDSLQWLAERGILAGPGFFYGDASPEHVRFALTATDDAIGTAVERLGT